MNNIIKVKTKYRINIKSLLIQVCGGISGLAFLPPLFLKDNYPQFDTMIMYIQVICILFMFLLSIFINIKKCVKCIPLYFLYILCLLLLVPRLNEPNVTTAMGFTLSLISIFSFFAINKKVIIDEFILGMVKYLMVIIALNIITMILFPSGLYNIGTGRKYFFLGHVNAAIKYYLPTWILLGYLKQRILHVRSVLWITWLICTISMLIIQSYTALFGAGIFALVYIVLKNKKIRSWFFDGRVIVICSFLIYRFLASPFFQNIIYFVGISVSRDRSIYLRLQMLTQAQQSIRESPWFGYGFLSDYARYIHLNNYYPSSAHNLFADILLCAGIIGLVLFFIFVFLCLSTENVKGFHKSEVFLAGLCAWGVMWNFEPYFMSVGIYLLIALLGICWNEGNIEKRQHILDKV